MSTYSAGGLTYDTGASGSGSAGSVVPYLSSEEGLQTVQQTQTKLASMTPPPATATTTGSVPTEQTDAQRQQAIKDAGQLPAGKTATGYSLDDVLSMGVKDMTGWKSNPDGTYTPDSTALKNLGITSSSSETDAANSALEAARAERETYYNKLKFFDTSNDPALKGILSGITSQWDSRISEMERINKSREAALTTTGVRTGSRYTGGAGGVFGSIISEEERQAVERLGELEQKKQSALAEAKQAYDSSQWNRYYQLAGVADKTYQEQLDKVKDLNKAAAEQSKKLKEENDKQALSDNIYNVVAGLGDKADAASIYAKLRNSGFSGTIDDVDKAWKALQPKDSANGLYKFSQTQVGHLLQYGFTGDQVQSMQDDLNHSGLDDVVAGLPKEAQQLVRKILYTTPTTGNNSITWAEAATRFGASGYPEIAVQLAGKSEEQILADIQNPTPSGWFLKYLKTKGVDIGDAKMDYLPEVQTKIVDDIYTRWDDFRAKVFTSQASVLSAAFQSLSAPDASAPAGSATEEGQ